MQKWLVLTMHRPHCSYLPRTCWTYCTLQMRDMCPLWFPFSWSAHRMYRQDWSLCRLYQWSGSLVVAWQSSWFQVYVVWFPLLQWRSTWRIASGRLWLNHQSSSDWWGTYRLTFRKSSSIDRMPGAPGAEVSRTAWGILSDSIPWHSMAPLPSTLVRKVWTVWLDLPVWLWFVSVIARYVSCLWL